MSVLVVGMSHRCAPVPLLERASMDEATRISATQKLVAQPSIDEAMIISTCNRVEVYAVTTGFHTGVNDVIEVLHNITGVDLAELRSHLYVRYSDAAAEHLLKVTAGLDSMVVGEQQIIGQVRTAYQLAKEAGTAGPAIHAIAQCALHTGKRVHTETDIDDAGASMVSFALDEAMKIHDWTDMHGKKAMVMGAGVMASMAATYLGKMGVDELVIANRTLARAHRLADHAEEAGVAARVIPFESRATAYADVDMIVSATGADTFIVTRSDIAEALSDKPLVLVDLSLPRDIEDGCAELPGVSLVNIESLHEVKQTAHAPAAAARAIVREELAAYTSAERIKGIAPSVAALRRYASELIESELARLDARTPLMASDDRIEVERTMRRLVDKLLHGPTVKVKELAATSGTVSYESALQELFNLPDSVKPVNGSVKVNVSDLPVDMTR